ncbi:MAG: nickel-dependent lactate racemase [Dehalococcoidia bacterium]|nr:nickel-dependent lactate racemase [Dehalococcoidia bacterium]
MRVGLEYGEGRLWIELPDDRTTVIEPISGPELPDPDGALKKALREPIASLPLRQIAQAGQTVAISVCDITRPQPRKEVLGAILSELDGIVRPEDVVILIATGTHRVNTTEELTQMLGREIADTHRVVNHVGTDPSTLIDLGMMGDGVPVSLNREWMAADLRITTGVVEPHFFAGFSGGPKMVAPGLAGIETVLALHDARRIGHQNSRWGLINGNPVHDAVRAIAEATGVDFSIDVTLNRDQQITGVFAGSLFAMHEHACVSVKNTSMQSVESAFDIVVTSNSGYPLDQNLYQAIKGISAAAEIVKTDGTIVCAAECRDGLPDHGGYGQILASRDTPEALQAMIGAPGYSVPDQWQVQIQARIQQRATVLMKTDGLGDRELRAAHIEPVADVEATVKDLLTDYGENATVCVLPEGPRTVPYLR